MSAATIARKAGMTRSNESGKLTPSRLGHESQVARCGSHSAGMRYPSAAGVSLDAMDAERSPLNDQHSKAIICRAPRPQRPAGGVGYGVLCEAGL